MYPCLKARGQEEQEKKRAKKRRTIRVMIYLSVAYAANVGGTGTLTGTGPNLVLKGMLSTLFGNQTPINFASWMAFAVPLMLVNLLQTWMWLQLYFMGVPWKKNKVGFWLETARRRAEIGRVLKER